MAKKVSYDQIAEKKLFQPAIDSANSLLKVLDKVVADLGLVLQTSIDLSKSKPLDSYKDIKKVEKAITDTEKAVKDLEKAEKERQKLQEKLVSLQTEEAQQTAQIKLQIQEQTKANKELAKEKLGLLGSYERESKRLIALRKQYKDLIVEEGKATKETEELKREIDALDKSLKKIDKDVGQNQRNVGNYAEAVDDLKGSFARLDTLIAGLTGFEVITGLIDFFKDFDFAGALFEKAIARVTISVRSFALVVNNALSEGDGFLDTLDKLGKGFETLPDKIAEAIEKQDKNIEVTREFNRALSDLEVRLARVQKAQEIAQLQSDNATTSLNKQREANIKALQLAENAAAIQLKIANERQEAAQRTAEVEKISGELSLATQEELAQATIEVIEAQKELELARQTSAQQAAQIDQDIAELRLDALIDGFDNQKTINERIIANDRLNLQRRRAILEQTEIDLEKSAARQQEVLNNQLQKIDPSAAAIDLEELLGISDPVEFTERLQQLGLSEILTTRQLEVVRELRIQRQDLVEATSDLNQAEEENIKTAEDILLLENAINESKEKGAKIEDVLANLEEKRLQALIDNLELSLALIKQGFSEIEAGSDEALKIEQELNEAILSQRQIALEKQEEQNEKEIEANKKKNEELKKQEEELSKAILNILQNQIDKVFEKRLSALDKQIEASREREDQLRELAAQGVEEASDNLALEQKRQAELERERERQLRRQRNFQLAVSAVSTYASKVEAGDPNALGSTIADISVLNDFINNLPGFYKGTEKIEDSLNPSLHSGKDDYIVRVDGSERVLSGSENKLIGKMGNLELATLAHNYQKGSIPSANFDLSPMNKKIDELINTIQNKPSYLGMDYNERERAITHTILSKNKVIRNHQKTGGIWG